MKQFTIKELLKYNNPCFFCKIKTAFKIVSISMNSNNIYNIIGSHKHPVSSVDLLEFNPILSSEEMIMYISTQSFLLKLNFYPETNKFQVSNLDDLTKYLLDHRLLFASSCDNCGTRIESCYIDFNLLHGFIDPISLSIENLIFSNENNNFHLESSFIEERSKLIVSDLTISKHLTNIEMPIQPLYNFTDKNHFISKMKTYLIFS